MIFMGTPKGTAHATIKVMEGFLVLILFLAVWFGVLPRIPGMSRFG
jgi:hypothetical protein